MMVEAKHRLGPRVLGGDAGEFELLLQTEGFGEITIGVETGKAIHRIFAKAEDFADFANGAASAIADDICRHRGAATAVAPIDFLDDAFAAVATGKIEIDVGPRGAAVGSDAAVVEKPIEEQ